MFLFLLLAVGKSKDCPKFECESDDKYFQNDTCVYFKNTTEGKYYVRECPSDGPNTRCEFKERENSLCYPPKVTYRYPGEDCDNSFHQCYPGTSCVDSKCKAGKGNCNSDIDCEVGYFCNVSVCANQNNNQTCTTDYMCENTHGCNGTALNPGRCIEYFTVPDYDYLATCEGNKSNLCSTGHCILHKGHNRCFGAAVNNRPAPFTCDSSVCKSRADENLNDAYLTTPCVCGYNSEQGKVCHLFYQDEKGGKKYFKLLKDWYSSEHVKKCHTLGRFSFACMKEHWGDYDEFMFRYYKFTQYPYQYFTDKCMRKALLPEFYHADEEWDVGTSLLVTLSLLTLA